MTNTLKRASHGARCTSGAQPHAEWQQHWVSPRALPALLQPLALKGRRVLELGSGTGNLTRALLEQGVEHIEAWEIDAQLPPVLSERVRWCVRDIMELTPSDLETRVLIAFAPYTTLPWIEQVLKASAADHVLLMVPMPQLQAWEAQGFRVVDVLSGSDFEPAARGEHAVIAKGLLAHALDEPAK